MGFKIIADTFSVARDSTHFIQLKSIKKPGWNEEAWLAIEIEDGGKYARSTVQSIIETIEDVFFEKSELDAYERFENTLKEINIIIKSLKEKRGDKGLGKISAIIGVFNESELHLTQSKNAEAYLIRRGKLSMISEGLGSRAKDLFVNIASGELLPNDKIIFATSRLLRLATQSQITQIFKDGVTEAVDSLKELVMAENSLNLGATCIYIKVPQRLSSTFTDGKGSALLVPLKAGLSKVQNWLSSRLKLNIKLPKGKKISKTNFSQKNILLSLVAAIVILVISVSLLMDSRRNQVLREEYRIRIEAMNQDLHVANTKGYANDKETANAILDKVEREARDILGTNYFRAEALALMEKVQATRDSINNITRLESVEPFIDLTAKNETIKALGLVSMDDNFFAYEYNNLYEIILDQVLDPKTIDESEVVTNAASIEDQSVIVFLTQSGRVMEYQNGAFSFADTSDANWKSGIDISAYGRNIYLLAPAENQIYKYSRLRGTYSSANEYNIDANLEGAISIAIDGNIYVLKEGGEITKIFKSKAQPFRISDLGADISEASKIFTRLELDHLYLLDSKNKRVVMIEKDRNGVARYLGQVVFSELPEVQDIYVNQDETKLYLLTEQGIYKVDI